MSFINILAYYCVFKYLHEVQPKTFQYHIFLILDGLNKIFQSNTLCLIGLLSVSLYALFFENTEKQVIQLDLNIEY